MNDGRHLASRTTVPASTSLPGNLTRNDKCPPHSTAVQSYMTDSSQEQVLPANPLRHTDAHVLSSNGSLPLVIWLRDPCSAAAPTLAAP